MKQPIARNITGLVILIVGIILMLDSLGVYDFGSLWSTWWPLLMIIGGVLIYLNDRKSYVWALFLGLAGLLLQLKNLDIVDVNVWQLIWPAIIIVVGASILANKSAAAPKLSKAGRDDATAILGGSDIRNTSEDYKGSNATAVMGGVKLDLRKARIKGDATIQLFAFWGGVEIIVPRGVVVKNQTSVIMAAVEDKTEQETSKDSPVLYITGDVIMAGVEIKN